MCALVNVGRWRKKLVWAVNSLSLACSCRSVQMRVKRNGQYKKKINFHKLLPTLRRLKDFVKDLLSRLVKLISKVVTTLSLRMLLRESPSASQTHRTSQKNAKLMFFTFFFFTSKQSGSLYQAHLLNALARLHQL